MAATIAGMLLTLIASLVLGTGPGLDRPATAAEGVAFAVAPHAKLAKTFESRWVLHSKDLRVKINGKKPPKGLIRKQEITETWTSNLKVRDEYLALGAGRPEKLRRVYEEIASRLDQVVEAGGQSDEYAFPRTSELEHVTVDFEWDAKAAKYERKPGSKKLAAEALAGAEEDLDWRSLLPKEKVAEGGRWELEADALTGLIGLPGGRLRLRTESEQDAFVTEELDAGLRAALEGKGSASWTETREEGGLKCAVIAIEATLECGAQVDTKAGESGSKQGAREKLEVKGEVLWELKAGHFRSAKFERHVELTKTVLLITTEDGVRREYAQETDFSGEGTLSARVE